MPLDKSVIAACPVINSNSNSKLNSCVIAYPSTQCEYSGSVGEPSGENTECHKREVFSIEYVGSISNVIRFK